MPLHYGPVECKVKEIQSIRTREVLLVMRPEKIDPAPGLQDLIRSIVLTSNIDFGTQARIGCLSP